jgi:hypothetical protein
VIAARAGADIDGAMWEIVANASRMHRKARVQRVTAVLIRVHSVFSGRIGIEPVGAAVENQMKRLLSGICLDLDANQILLQVWRGMPVEKHTLLRESLRPNPCCCRPAAKPFHRQIKEGRMARVASRFLDRRQATRLRTAARYLAFSGVLHLGWETAHLPLYTLWFAPLNERVFAVVHCTGGDVLIAASTLALAILLAAGDWPRTDAARWRAAVLATFFGVSYTIFSEWLNVEVRQSWTYALSMPLLPPLGTGLTPVLQWLVLPPIALMLATLPLRDRS